MKSASNATYLSKNALAAYSVKRKERMASKQQLPSQQPNVLEQIKPKGFKEDVKEEEIKTEEAQPQQVVIKEAAKLNISDERYNSCEEVDSDELDGELNLSDDGQEEEAEVFRAQNKAQKSKMRSRPARVFRQEIDTNVFKIGFATLKDQAEIATGDPEFCTKCKAILNVHSKIEVTSVIGKEDQQVWKCEFCNTDNQVCLEDEEKPQTAAVNYIVEAAAQVQDKNAMGNKDISVIFCMDVSGSMCVSQPIKGKFSLKGDKTKEMKDLMKFGDGSDQFLQGEKNVTYVSRMQCLQAAIEQQISDMGNGAPDRKIGLVTFNNEVSIIGDGSQDPVTVGGDKLEDYDFLIKNGVEQGIQRMKNKIGQTQKELAKKLMSIEETGPTALGPAVATSIAMAGESGAGSQVVICTDGLANVGLGAFDDAQTPEQLQKVEEFYERVGEYAKSKGLTVNIVSIIGDECNLDSLCKLAELTGGNVERVDPVALTSNFANILSQPIIASNVVAKIKLHKGLLFRNEEQALLSEDCSLLVKDLGNVTEDTEITFEYGLKKVSELIEMEDIDLTEIKSFPFQTQIEYKALDGSRCIRVITDNKVISTERDELEQKANYNILGQHAVQQSANMARQGNHREAQAYAKGWGRRMKKQAVTTEQCSAQAEFVDNFKDLYNNIGQQDQLEQVMEMADDHQEEAKMMQGAPRSGGGGGIFKSLGNAFGGSKAKKSKMSDGLSDQLYFAAKKGKKK